MRHKTFLSAIIFQMHAERKDILIALGRLSMQRKKAKRILKEASFEKIAGDFFDKDIKKLRKLLSEKKKG